jgi:hypothetical protein
LYSSLELQDCYQNFGNPWNVLVIMQVDSQA